MKSALVLCRTPFQAYLLESILFHEEIGKFNLLYFTQQNSAEDRHYYEKLSSRAKMAEYVHVAPQRFDILGHLLFRARARRFVRDFGYDVVLLASFDNFVFSAIARMQSKSEVVTFDDGMSNIFIDGIYRQRHYRGRGEFYRFAFRAHKFNDFRIKIKRHYTIYPQFENIVPRAKLRPIFYFDLAQGELNDGGPVIFIGQPFNQVLDEYHISILTGYLRNQKIDYYLKHPRESVILDIGARELKKNGLIAEEVIKKVSGDIKPTIVSWQSNVIFNFPPQLANKKLIIFDDAYNRREIEFLAESTGCIIETLSIKLQ